MPSSGMFRSVALIISDVSEKRIASIIRVTRIGELGTLAITSNRSMLRGNTNYMKKEALEWSKKSEAGGSRG
jgi:demethoxyubiquinone hydroxylase (CLK1/Coq7/Cat5 family)